ncbi:MAG TPA: VOC family protein [Gammaproteobacteria bacterium]|nr:VOC family protein [Gammaproteobacteria bacterium]
MAQDIWLNLPVKDIARSITFFTKIGFALNPGPGNSEQSASFTIGKKQIVLMLFVQDVFSGFTNNALSDTAKGTEVLFSLGADSRAQVNDIADQVKSAGGIVFGEPRESNGFMYGCGFCDPDGHRWNVLFMDASKMPNQKVL